MFIYCCLHKVDIGNSRYFNRILETKEDSGPTSFFRTHLQKILPEICYAALCNGVVGVTRKHRAEGTFSAAVPSHYRMHLAWPYDKIYPFENFLVADAGVQIFYFKKIFHFCLFFFFGPFFLNLLPQVNVMLLAIHLQPGEETSDGQQEVQGVNKRHKTQSQTVAKDDI